MTSGSSAGSAEIRPQAARWITMPCWRYRMTAPDWATTVDWNQPDKDVATLVHRSRERVRQVRVALGKPHVAWISPGVRDFLPFAKKHRRILTGAPFPV